MGLTDDIIGRLRDLGISVKVANVNGQWQASARGHVTTAPTEQGALAEMLRRASRPTRTIDMIDPNVDYAPHPAARVARRRNDDLSDIPANVEPHLAMHDPWWERPRGAQLAKVEDALRMAKSDLDIEQARRLAEIDLTANGGRGHIFRSYATSNGLDAKTASKVWLLLAPLSSQLAVDLDLRQQMRLASTASHWQVERAAHVLRHHTGHDHIPLGLFTACILLP